jgi:hypothetical protein
MIRPLAFFAIIILSISSYVRADSADSPDALQKLYTDGDYKDLVPLLNKVLALKGADAAQYNKYDLLMMKGDASLHLHSKSQAADAFKAASSATEKADDAAVALATSQLIGVSGSNLTYTRKTKTANDDKPLPIDIVEPASRKLAFAALETDLAARAKPRVDAAVKSTSLSQVAQVATGNELANLKAVEIAAAGTPADTQQMLGDLGTHANTLMDTQLEDLTQRLNSDLDAVNNRVQHPKPGQQANHQIMNIPTFIQDVRGVDNDAKQVGDYAKAMSPVFGSSIDLKPVEDKAKDIHETAAKLLKQAKADGY